MTASVANNDSALSHYLSHHEDDAIQAEMMAEALIRVDEKDRVLGAVSKLEAHRGTGFLHRAFSVLLFNTEGRLLLQRRADSKITFPGIWANSCCSHPLFIRFEQEPWKHLGVKRAAIRKISQELGVADGELQADNFILMTRVHYRAESLGDWTEEEMDYILVARAEVSLCPNPNEVSETRWVNSAELQAMLDDPANDIAPWFRIIATEFLPDWWPELNNQQALEQLSDNEIHRYTDAAF